VLYQLSYTHHKKISFLPDSLYGFKPFNNAFVKKWQPLGHIAVGEVQSRRGGFRFKHRGYSLMIHMTKIRNSECSQGERRNIEIRKN